MNIVGSFLLLLYLEVFQVVSLLSIPGHFNNFSAKALLASSLFARRKKLDTRMNTCETPIESAHLKLHDVATVHNENDITSQYNDVILISEYVQSADNTTILACVGGKTKLEHFSIHVFGSNYSSNSNAYYNEVVMNPKNNTMVEKYTKLWEEGLYMAQSKVFKNDWVTINRGFISLESFLAANHAKIENIIKTSENVRAQMLDFLKFQGSSIRGYDWTRYQFQSNYDKQTTMDTLKEFCEWFRSGFPYYYSQCLHQGCLARENNQYLGTVCPTSEESTEGQAGRTELYLCGTCEKASRFPRFNDMRKILDTRRGRCGEYSVLILHLLQVLGYSARWVADRDDHVWAEVLLDGSWVHVDPCEAAVNEPLIYESWGKNPTYVLAYSTDCSVCDVTDCYVKDASVISSRRLAENISDGEFQRLLCEANDKLSMKRF